VGDDAAGRRVIFEHVDGGLRLNIDEHSREVVVHLFGELRNAVIGAKESPYNELPPHMKRLFPTAYHSDEKRNEEYRRLTHSDLADAHLAVIDDAVTLLSPGRTFTTPELERFVRALNAMRLVLGTVLDVSEDEGDADSGDVDSGDADEADSDDPTAMQRQVYDYLGWLLHMSLDQLRT
jgi:hypothetical protein